MDVSLYIFSISFLDIDIYELYMNRCMYISISQYDVYIIYTYIRHESCMYVCVWDMYTV